MKTKLEIKSELIMAINENDAQGVEDRLYLLMWHGKSQGDFTGIDNTGLGLDYLLEVYNHLPVRSRMRDLICDHFAAKQAELDSVEA